ncbi:MAG: lipopolysaccharide biosynthesis protein [Dongiaceae bacterium]
MTSAERFRKLISIHDGEADLKRRVVRGGAFAMAAEAMEFVLRLTSIVILARLLVPEHFGLIGMVTAITAIAERFKDFGLGIATVQRQDITHEHVSTLFWVNAGIGMALVLLVGALAFPIARFYDDDRLFHITLAIASGFLWSGITIQHQALLRRQLKFAQIGVIQVVASGLSIAVAVGLAVTDFGYWALVGREVSRNLFVAIGTWACLPWIPGAPSRQVEVRSMLSFGGDVTAFNLVWFLATNVDQILIGKFFGAVPLGLYRQGISLVLAPMNQMTYPVHSIAESAMSRLQGDPEKYRRYYIRIVSTLSLVTMPLAAFLGVFAEEVVLVALGERWIAAAEFFRILAVAAFMRPAASTAGFVMLSSGESRRYLWCGLFGALSLSAFVVLGIRWGPSGVAYGHVAATYLLLIPMLYWGLWGTPVRVSDFVASVRKPIVASVLMAGVLYALKQGAFTLGPFGSLALGSIAGFIAYFGTWLILPGGRAELARMVADLAPLFGLAGVSGSSKEKEGP